MKSFQSEDWNPREGRLPLHYYFASDEVSKIAEEAHLQFMAANALAPKAFPSCKRMENEVVSMVLGLLHGGANARGSMTSGGTESIILAVKAARDYASSRRLLSKPNIILPDSAHPAFEKAAQLLGVQAIRVPLGPDYRSDVNFIEAAINDDTLLVVGSAPSLPFGLMDHIGALSNMALRRNVWLHVDACIGGMLAPFVSQLGYPVKPFDFALAGVRSMSVDLHKFGYSVKGASLVLYKDAEYHRFQFSRFSKWPKGEYFTPTLAGTRSGGPIASAWAVMHYLGLDGYLNITRRLMNLRTRFIEDIQKIPELDVVGDPELSVVAFSSECLNIFSLSKEMQGRNWYMSLVRQPPAIQQTINLVHEELFEHYFADLSDSVNAILAKGESGDDEASHHAVVTY